MAETYDQIADFPGLIVDQKILDMADSFITCLNFVIADGPTAPQVRVVAALRAAWLGCFLAQESFRLR